MKKVYSISLQDLMVALSKTLIRSLSKTKKMRQTEKTMRMSKMKKRMMKRRRRETHGRVHSLIRIKLQEEKKRIMESDLTSTKMASLKKMILISILISKSIKKINKRRRK
jgi:hypothetical protein